MIAFSPRDLFLGRWLATMSGNGLPKLWPRMSPMAETEFTTGVISQEVPVCPFAVRALPLGSFGIVHGDSPPSVGTWRTSQHSYKWSVVETL